MLVAMVFQTLYFLIALYWVGRLNTDDVATIGIATNLSFITLALTTRGARPVTPKVAGDTHTTT